jgi:transcriptional regulator with XRE-family HTH domain
MIGPATSSPPARTRPPRPLLRTTVGEVLRRTRLAQHRTLADVARSARVSVPYLSELERGRKEASSEVLAAICEALRVDLPDLLAEIRRVLVYRRDQRPAVLRLSPALGPRAPAADTGDTAGPAADPDGTEGVTEAAGLVAAAPQEDSLVTPGAMLQFPGDLPHGSQAPLDGPADPAELGPRQPAEMPENHQDEQRAPGAVLCQLAA